MIRNVAYPMRVPVKKFSVMSEELGSLCCGCLVAGRRVSPLRDSDLHNLYAQLSQAPSELELGAWDGVCWECRSLLLRILAFKRQVRLSYTTLRQHLLEDPSLGNIDGITKPPHLQIHNVFSYHYPIHLTPIHNDSKSIKNEFWNFEPEATKVDVEFIKSEPEDNAFDNLDTHSEPETFANSITNDVEEVKEPKPKKEAKEKKKGDRKEKKKQKGKLKKEKIKKKVKEKPKKVLKERKKKKEKIDDFSDIDNASIATADLEVSSDGLTDLESVIDYYNDIPTVSKTEKPQKDKVKTKTKVEKEQFDPTEIKLITLTHEEMLKEREKEAVADYFVKCPHQCKDCILGFKYERTLQTHIETKHAETAGSHVCAICNVRFATAPQYEEHSRRHLQRYKCCVCGKKSLTLLPMLKHVRNHKEYKCEVCGQLSGSLFRHQTHTAREHREKPQCVECSKMFSSRKTYRYHMNVIHKGQNRFPCPHCGKIYQWKSNLWRHIKNHKARDNGELFCAPCDKKFSSIATYQQHLKISRKHVTENEFNYMCSECGKKFANKTRLRDHVDWDHLKKINYRCLVCDKPFKSNTSLYVHMQNVHKNKDEKDNLCHVCGKSYQNIAKLKYHIVAMHTTETPYSCDQCPSAFSWYSSLYRHVKEVHEKVRLKKKRVRRKDGAPPAPPLQPPPSHLPPQHM